MYTLIYHYHYNYYTLQLKINIKIIDNHKFVIKLFVINYYDLIKIKKFRYSLKTFNFLNNGKLSYMYIKYILYSYLYRKGF